jgi:hypothetical protein
MPKPLSAFRDPTRPERLRGHLRLGARLLGQAALHPLRPRLYLLDPSFEAGYGHYLTVAKNLAEECAAGGWNFTHLTGPLDEKPSPARLRHFHWPGYLPMRTRPDLVEPIVIFRNRRRSMKILNRFVRALAPVLALDRIIFPAGESHFLFYTGDLLFPWAVLRSLPLAPRQHLAVFQFTLPARFEEPREQKRLRRHARLLAGAYARAGAPAARVHLCTDSPALERWLGPSLDGHLEPLQPPVLSRTEIAALPTPADLAHRPHPCGYFGYFRQKHGWPVVQQMLERLAGRDTRWFLQLGSYRAEPPAVAHAQEVAAAAGATLHLGFLPLPEFSAVLGRCSSLLLPYHAASYALLSSGKLILALCYGCYPVVPADTWLAEVVRELDYGLVAAEGEWLDVPRRLAALDFPQLWELRRERVRAFLEQFTARSLLASLRRLAAGERTPARVSAG